MGASWPVMQSFPPAINRHLSCESPLGPARDPKSISTARVLLYRHRALADGLTLDHLAQDLLDQISAAQAGLVSRGLLVPYLWFPCLGRPWTALTGSRDPQDRYFSLLTCVGGLVVKLALLKASKKSCVSPNNV